MSKVFLSILLCMLIYLMLASVESKKSNSDKLTLTTNNGKPKQKHKPSDSKTSSSDPHSDQIQPFIDHERQDSKNGGQIGWYTFNKYPELNHLSSIGLENPSKDNKIGINKTKQPLTTNTPSPKPNLEHSKNIKNNKTSNSENRRHIGFEIFENSSQISHQEVIGLINHDKSNKSGGLIIKKPSTTVASSNSGLSEKLIGYPENHVQSQPNFGDQTHKNIGFENFNFAGSNIHYPFNGQKYTDGQSGFNHVPYKNYSIYDPAPIIIVQKDSGPSFGAVVQDAISGINERIAAFHKNQNSAKDQEHEAFMTWLRERYEQKKKQIAENSAFTNISGSGNVTTETVITTNATTIFNNILDQNELCRGSGGILDNSEIHTLVPCNLTNIDSIEMNYTEPIEKHCKTVILYFVQLNTDTRTNKTVTVRIKQKNSTVSNPNLIYAYDIDFVYCVHPAKNSGAKKCKTKSFSTHKTNNLNKTFGYLHNVNVTLLQYNTSLYENGSCAETCEPDSSQPRNLTSVYLGFSVLPKYSASITTQQCLAFTVSPCPSNLTTPCNVPPYYVKQTIKTNTTLSKSDFANINFILHESPASPFVPQKKDANDAQHLSAKT